MDESGQDIENFGNKMAEMDHHITRTGSAPIDLSTLVATDFIYCKVPAFQMNATGLHNLVDRNPKALSSDEIIRTLKTKFHYLKAQGLWCHSKGDKLDI